MYLPILIVSSYTFRILPSFLYIPIFVLCPWFKSQSHNLSMFIPRSLVWILIPYSFVPWYGWSQIDTNSILVTNTPYLNSVKWTEFSFILTPSCTDSKWGTPKTFYIWALPTTSIVRAVGFALSALLEGVFCWIEISGIAGFGSCF